jgi:hypothetical protein
VPDQPGDERAAPGRRKGPSLSPSTRRKVFFALVGVVLVGVVVGIVLAVRAASGPTPEEVAAELAPIVGDAQARAERANVQIDVVALRSSLATAAPDYVIDLAASQDRRIVGVAAREARGDACVLIWTAVGGPRTVTVYDPVLPCRGRIALAAVE